MAATQNVAGWCGAILVGALLMPIANSSTQSIIQTKVAPEKQGRVFGALMSVSQISAPLAMMSSGPLADNVFEPRADTGRGVIGLLSPLTGRGPAAGMAAMLMLSGVLGIAAAVTTEERRAEELQKG